MRKLPVIICVFTLVLFSSCDFLLDMLDSGSGNFSAQDMRTDKHYKVDAEQLATGKYCTVWVEKSSGVTSTQAQQIANEYDNKIYQKMLDNFSITNFSLVGFDFKNILQLADELTDNDGKLCILLLDIKDGYKKGVNDAYVAGYFWGGDFFDQEGSNGRDMIYIDTNPGLTSDDGINEAYCTFAHELQHLMNFTTTFAKRNELNQQGQIAKLNYMDTWIDEGLASAAEYIYSGEHLQKRIDWYNYNGFKESNKPEHRGLIDKGNNFFVWGNRENESDYAALDDYATVYLFFQWLRLQSSSAGIYKTIISSSKSNHEAVVDAISGYTTWQPLLQAWLAANRINASSGALGYMNDSVLKNVKAPGSSSIATSISLASGEGVYSLANSQPTLTGQGSNIKNVYLTSSTVTSSFQAGSTLLTYNANTKIDGLLESGKTTGVPISASASITSSQGRSVASGVSKPYRIDVGEKLRNKPIDTEQLKGFGKINRAENE